VSTLDEMRRRCRAKDFDPSSRFFALDGERVVGYATFHANGRISFPWCRVGHEHRAEELHQSVLQAMRSRGLKSAFAAYRADWPAQRDFFLGHGFRHARDMVNFVVDLAELPTPAARPGSPIVTVKPEDVPTILALAPEALRTHSAAELERHLFQNAYFRTDSLFCLRSRQDGTLAGIGILIENNSFADPLQVDPAMPCFRLGAFGTEGMQTKRINGLFSFLVRAGRDVNALGLDLLGYAAAKLRHTSPETIAGQVPSDVPHLIRFYQQYFRRQGSFPVFERDLSS
jgi:hypothetical protein